MKNKQQIVYTIEDLCEMCYTCVRVCPAKAISITNGQAQVIPERCIACGNCIRVCTRNAKMFRNNETDLLTMIENKENMIAVIAPSFPAEFKEVEDYRKVVGAVRSLGFDKVVEVAFGADIVAEHYKNLLANSDKNTRFISSDCPAVVNYITKYHPRLTSNLAPIVSPVMAIVRVLKHKYANKYKIVFFGPCIAKKDESDEVDLTITFTELRSVMSLKNISAKEAEPSEFDPPHSGRGAVFPISRGLIQTINLKEDVVEGNIVVADGKSNFKEAINEFDNGLISDHHLELLCCEGCIMGPGMSELGKRYENRAYVTNYVKEKLNNIDVEEWKKELEATKEIDFSRSFEPDDVRVLRPSQEELDNLYKKMGKTRPEDHLNCQACGYDSCEEHAIAVLRGLAEVEMCLPYMIKELHKSVDELNFKNVKLANMRQALKQSEKLAHLGQLSAGIAHELNNPLGVVIMYSNILLDEAGPNSDVAEDLKMITEQAQRCKNIVGGLLNFARKNKVSYESISVVELIQQCLKSVLIPEDIEVEIKNYVKNSNINVDIEQMTQALSNIVKNAVEAISDKGKIIIYLYDTDDYINIEIEDTGSGINNENLEKVFTPFFTTKGLGKGTGLGLPTVYGVVKMHKGKIRIETNNNPEKGRTGTKFIIDLPKNPQLF